MRIFAFMVTDFFWSEMALASQSVLYIPERLNCFRQHDNKVSTSSKPLLQFYTEPLLITPLLAFLLYGKKISKRSFDFDTGSASSIAFVMNMTKVNTYFPVHLRMSLSVLMYNMCRKNKNKMTEDDRKKIREIISEHYSFKGRVVFFIYKQIRPLYRYLLKKAKQHDAKFVKQ